VKNLTGLNRLLRQWLRDIFRLLVLTHAHSFEHLVYPIKNSFIIEIIHKIIHHSYQNCYADKGKCRFARTNSLGKFKVRSASVLSKETACVTKFQCFTQDMRNFLPAQFDVLSDLAHVKISNGCCQCRERRQQEAACLCGTRLAPSLSFIVV
jgi:hypothetical protein